MTTIKLSILKDDSWDCEGAARTEASFTWKTDGTTLNAEEIARELSRVLRMLEGIPLKGASFRKDAGNPQPPSKAELELARSQYAYQHSLLNEVLHEGRKALKDHPEALAAYEAAIQPFMY